MRLVGTRYGQVAVTHSALCIVNSAFDRIGHGVGEAFDIAAALFTTQAAWLDDVLHSARPAVAPPPPAVFDSVDPASVAALHAGLWNHIFERFAEHPQDNTAFTALIRRRLEANGLDRTFFTGKRCADLGCGGGRFTLTMRDLGAADLWGVDIAERNIAFLQRQADEAGASNLHLVRASIDDTGLPAGAFDVVVLNGVAHHAADLGAVLTEAARITRPGGMLWLFVVGAFEGPLYRVNQHVKDVMRHIPVEIAVDVLNQAGLPPHRFNISLDCMYAVYYFRPAAMIRHALHAAGFADIRDQVTIPGVDIAETLAARLGSRDIRLLATRADH